MVMAHGMKAKPGDGGSPVGAGTGTPLSAAAATAASSAAAAAAKTGIGSRRIFPPQFKLQVLDSYRHDADCKGNQRATARKYGIHRRQIQKWLQAENNLRSSVVSAASAAANNNNNNCSMLVNKNVAGVGGGVELRTTCLMALEPHRQRDDAAVATTRAAAVAAGSGSIQQARLSPVRSPAMATHTADIASPALGAHAHMPMDLSVRARPAEAAPALLLLHASSSSSSAAASRASPALSPRRPCSRASSSRSRSRSRSPLLRMRTLSVIMPPSSTSSSSSSSTTSDTPEIWDLSSKKTQIPCASPPAKPLFKPYLLDDEEKPTANTSTTTTTAVSRYGGGGSGGGYDYAPPYYGYSNLYETNVDVGYVFDESGVLQPAYLRPFTTLHQPTTHHQRAGASYPLDFKLRAAVDSYQQHHHHRPDDAKFNNNNVHRRQVPKWLKQERADKHIT